MKKVTKALVVLIPLLLAAGIAVNSEKAQIDPDHYPFIGEKEMGQLRWALKVSDQPLDDFSNMDTNDNLDILEYHYCIAFITYFLAIEQYHKLPACQEIIQSRIDRLIQKMIQKPTWQYWAYASQGISYLKPSIYSRFPELHDPVGYRNVFYSGHLGHMIGLYEMLYRDLKWDEPGSLVFEWSDEEKYIYDNHSLQAAMHSQMSEEPHCIECEPNVCFTMCNQHPVLSFMLYDQIHGTSLSEVRDLYLNFFLEKRMIDPITHETAACYLVEQDMTVSQANPRFRNAYDLIFIPAASLELFSMESSVLNGWCGTFMHAWQPEYIERHYPYQREHHVINIDNERASLRYSTVEPFTSYGFFAMLASEVGDDRTRDRLLNYTNQIYKPVWQDGMFRYPYNLKKYCINLTGYLIAIARANPKNGFWKMHNQPFDDKHFDEPKVTEVDFPNVLLRRAVYDREKAALIVTTEPGAQKSGKSSFRIIQLEPKKSYALIIDGSLKETIKGRDSMTLDVPMDTKHDFVLIQK